MTTIFVRTPEQFNRWLRVAEPGEELEYAQATATPVTRVRVNGVEEIRKNETFKAAALAAHEKKVLLYQYRTKLICAEDGAAVTSYRARRIK